MKRPAAAVVASTLVLGGCLDELLESPYVLASGLGEVRSISPGQDGRLLAATSTGLYAIDTEGKAERVGEAARAVSAFVDRRYTIEERSISWRTPAGETGGIFSAQPPTEVDLLAGYDELVLLSPVSVMVFPPDRIGQARELRLVDPRAVALGPDNSYLVVTATKLYRLDTDLHLLATNLVDARAAAMDDKGRIYVAQGSPTELWRVDPDGEGAPKLVNIAKWLGDVRDMHFGVGAFPRENLYLANGAGSVDYVRPP